MGLIDLLYGTDSSEEAMDIVSELKHDMATPLTVISGYISLLETINGSSFLLFL